MNSLCHDAPRERIAYSIKEATSLMGLSRSTIYKLAADGKLRIRKVAGRSIITRDDLLGLLA